MSMSPDAAQSPVIEHQAPVLVAGLCERYRFASIAGIPGQWRRFTEAAGRLPRPVGATAYGVMLPVPGFDDGFDYLTGMEVAAVDDLPGEFSHGEIPGGSYAVFEHRGPVSGINGAWNLAWTRWLPHSGYRVVDNPVLFEEYGEGFDPVKWEGLVRLWAPVL